MAGMRVVVVACDEDGNIDLADLRAKAEQHKARLAALMVTYPSTHGVFEARSRRSARSIHAAGGQVYMDGANFNALVGLRVPRARRRRMPHEPAQDLLHPARRRRPRHGTDRRRGAPRALPAGPRRGVNPATARPGAVSAAPWGSALILPISWAYIAMMGGRTRATQVAILNANYIATRLRRTTRCSSPGRTAWWRTSASSTSAPLKEASGISAEDVAKRLMDYGFHAPTMSLARWPAR